MKNCRAKEGTEKRKGSESENFAVNHRYYDALKTIAILRAIDSKTLNLLFVSIRVRSAFLKKALQQNHLKETQIREWSASESYRKRTTTYYIITRTGLKSSTRMNMVRIKENGCCLSGQRPCWQKRLERILIFLLFLIFPEREESQKTFRNLNRQAIRLCRCIMRGISPRSS